MSRLTAAYVAGLIDGEGCIYINPHKDKNSTAATVVTVGMTAKAIEVLKSLHKQYGGWLGRTRAATEKWEAAHAWTVSGPAAAAMLREIQDHLILKSEQARLGIRLEDIKASLPRRPNGSTAWTEHAKDHGRTIHRRIQELNAKGPAAPAAPATVAGQPPIARRVAGQWVTDQGDLFSDTGWAPFKGPWPTSGMTRNGSLYPPLKRALPIAANGSSSPPGLLLKTPTAQLAVNGGSQDPEKRKAGGHGPTLADQVEYELLPAPRCADGMIASNMQSNRDRMERSSRRRGTLEEEISLLPTPAARDWKSGQSNLIGTNARPLNEVVQNCLLPTPMAADGGLSRGTTGGGGGGGFGLRDTSRAISRGETTPPPSTAGRRFSAAQPHRQLSLDEQDNA